MKYLVYKSNGMMQTSDEFGTIFDTPFVSYNKMKYSHENEEYVKSIAINGEYEIEDDGVVEVPSTEDRLKAI